jgi:hypothetical protein
MTNFDPQRYKATTHDHWQAAAAAWNRWDPTIARWVGPATNQLIDMMQVRAGHAVLDVAAGLGQPNPAAGSASRTDGPRAGNRHLIQHPRLRAAQRA